MQGLEIELKWPVSESDMEQVKAAMESITGRTYVYSSGPRDQLNVWYGLGNSSAASRRLRISRLHPYTRGCAYDYLVTNKGPNKDPKFKVCPEDNFGGVRFHNPLKALAFFEFLGFREIFKYERIRTDFRFNGVLVSYDQFPLIGDYIEIEGSKDEILKVAALLGLEEADSSNLSYRAIFDQWRADHPDSTATNLVWEGERHFLAKL